MQINKFQGSPQDSSMFVLIHLRNLSLFLQWVLSIVPNRYTHTHKSPSLLPHFHFLHFPRKIKRKWALELCVKTNFNLFWEIVGYSGDGGKRKRYNSLYRLLSFFEWRCWFLWPLWVLHSKHSLSVFLLRFTMFLYIIRPLQSINLQNPVIIIVKLEKEIGVEICFDLG